jgi:NitT/TauT family transport system substrate-binding protein
MRFADGAHRAVSSAGQEAHAGALRTGIFVRLRAALAGVAALACALQVTTAGAADPQTVTLFIGTTPDYANIYVARDKGFFEAEGLKLDIRLFPSGSAATDGFRSGKVEFVASGDIPAMRLCEVMGAKVIAPTGFDGFSPVFMTKASIKTPADLKGKTFASRLGSSGELFVQKVRDKYKLGPNDFKLINLEPTDMVAVLDRGDIDGFFWFSPFEERSAQISGNKVRLFMRGGEVGFTNEVTLTARGDLVAQNPDMIKRFLKALIKGSDYAMSHRDETVNIVSAALKLDKKASEVTKQMNFPLRFDKRLYDRYGESAKFMMEKKFVEKPVDFSTCFWTDGIAAADPARVEKR